MNAVASLHHHFTQGIGYPRGRSDEWGDLVVFTSIEAYENTIAAESLAGAQALSQQVSHTRAVMVL